MSSAKESSKKNQDVTKAGPSATADSKEHFTATDCQYRSLIRSCKAAVKKNDFNLDPPIPQFIGALMDLPDKDEKHLHKACHDFVEKFPNQAWYSRWVATTVRDPNGNPLKVSEDFDGPPLKTRKLMRIYKPDYAGGLFPGHETDAKQEESSAGEKGKELVREPVKKAYDREKRKASGSTTNPRKRAKKIATTEAKGKGKGKGKSKATDADMNTDDENSRDDSQEEFDALAEPDQEEDNRKEAAKKGPKQWMSKSKEATETSAPVQPSFDIFDVDLGHPLDFGNQQNQMYPPIATDSDPVLVYGNGGGSVILQDGSAQGEHEVPIDPAIESHWPDSHEVLAGFDLEVQGTQYDHELRAEPGCDNRDMD
ncbi:hypothetical protein FALBO_10632 [Fusarium albosuccineum]|uniref:Uncharacterized protein n=1 Tax=Fusarium albosuccineum TaxID=1237068 RepID=A0A8H4P9L7_9HYPO|nr:hypothetical protein FALBO_10632 [Fusarium albosuccineum]